MRVARLPGASAMPVGRLPGASGMQVARLPGASAMRVARLPGASAMQEASAGLNSRGVTKTITAYMGLTINGQPIDLLDTPGVGDTDVTPMKLLTLIEQETRLPRSACDDTTHDA